MIPISKAINIVKRQTRPTAPAATVRLNESVGRILAEDILADSDMPPFDRSQMDGYAVKARDTTDTPVSLKIVGESAAGRGWQGTLGRGEAVRIMTGAPVPNGADAVQKIESTSEANNVVTVAETTEKGRYIVRKGAEIKRGQKLFRTGERIDERMIASLAAVGYANVQVSEQPLVSILATGSEIVGIDKQPGRDQIRNSNSVMLRSMCESAGAKVKLLPHTGDDLEKLKRVISKSTDGKRQSSIADRKSEILVITGGVSVGKYDLTKAALGELGAEIFFERVRLKPGKPTVFGRLNDTLVFGLPGNPVSAAVTFYLFVRMAIMKMQNASKIGLKVGHAILSAPAKAAKERDTYLPATLETDENGVLKATPLRWLGSSDFIGFARADALVFLKAGARLDAGDVAPISFL